MNDEWVRISRNRHGSWIRDSYEHRLDCLGLLETSWILFAGLDRYKNCDYGYPGMDSYYNDS